MAGEARQAAQFLRLATDATSQGERDRLAAMSIRASQRLTKLAKGK